MGLTLLCAASGLGKTTYLCEQLARLAAQGRSVGGVAAPAVFEQGRRVGYDLLNLRSGVRQPLARAVGMDSAAVFSAAGAPAAGRYRFADTGLQAGNEAIIRAVREGLDITAIDEVGPLELQGGGWTPGLEFALQACRPGQRLIITVRPSLADKLPAHFPASVWATQTRVAPPWPAVFEA